MTSFQYATDPRRRKITRLVAAARRELQKAFSEEKEEKGFTQAQLARTLGVNRSVVNRQLMGTENLTLETLAQFAWVLGRGLTVRFPKDKHAEGDNQAPVFSNPVFIVRSTASQVARAPESDVTRRVSSSS